MQRPAPEPPNRIRELREDEGLTQEELGARCMPPMTKAMISKRESGVKPCTIGDFRRIGAALNRAWWDLLPLPPLAKCERALLDTVRTLRESDQRVVYRTALGLKRAASQPDEDEV